MDIKRILTTVIGLPLVAIIFIFGNVYVVDVVFAIISAIGLYEYFNSIKEKFKPVMWIGYLASALIAFIHIIPKDILLNIIAFLVPMFIALLFIQVIISNMKTNINDIAMTLFGVCYVALFIVFLPIIHGLSNGKILIGYVFVVTWGTDIFAYIIGKTMGKHKFSQISPNKTIEGCVGGTIGGVLLSILYIYLMNTFFGVDFSYVSVLIISVILSIIGQIGDFAASSIKRYAGIKDFGNLIPGHGGMIDRFDSVIFVAPFAYILLSLMM